MRVSTLASHAISTTSVTVRHRVIAFSLHCQELRNEYDATPSTAIYPSGTKRPSSFESVVLFSSDGYSCSIDGCFVAGFNKFKLRLGCQEVRGSYHERKQSVCLDLATKHSCFHVKI